MLGTIAAHLNEFAEKRRRIRRPDRPKLIVDMPAERNETFHPFSLRIERAEFLAEYELADRNDKGDTGDERGNESLKRNGDLVRVTY